MILKNKIIIISGSSGIYGTEIVKYLLKQKANVIGLDIKNNKKKINDLKKKYKKSFFYYNCDATNEHEVKKINNLIIKKFKRIDVLINLASITDPVEGKKSIIKFEDFNSVEFEHILSKNIMSTFIPSKIFGKEMIKKKNGSIINFSSTYALVGPDQKIYENKNKKFFIKNAAYPTSKGGIISFTKYLSSYWGNKNVRTNCVVPGGAQNKQKNIFIKNYSNKTPLQRMAKRTDLNGIIHLLCSDEASYITGSILVVDGGWTSI